MRIAQPLNANSHLAFALVLAFGALLALPGCSVNVKKNGEGEEKKVDIETPMGSLHVSKDADVRDIGLPVYPGARRKEQSDDGHDNTAHVNISSGLFGLKVVAIEYSVRRSAGENHRLLQGPTQEIWRGAGMPCPGQSRRRNDESR